MEEEKETEELDMSKKPREEIAVFGLGVALNHLKEIAKTQKEIVTVLRYLENKVEALLDEPAQERLAQIKRRF